MFTCKKYPLTTHINTSSVLCLHCQGIFTDYTSTLPLQLSTQFSRFSRCCVTLYILRCLSLSTLMHTLTTFLSGTYALFPTQLNGSSLFFSSVALSSMYPLSPSTVPKHIPLAWHSILLFPHALSSSIVVSIHENRILSLIYLFSWLSILCS